MADFKSNFGDRPSGARVPQISWHTDRATGRAYLASRLRKDDTDFVPFDTVGEKPVYDLSWLQRQYSGQAPYDLMAIPDWDAKTSNNTQDSVPATYGGQH